MIWIVCSGHSSECAEQEGYDGCTIDEVNTHLQNVIKNMDEISVTDFLKDANIKKVKKTLSEKIVQISEDLVVYENECDKDAKFIHTWKNDQMSSSTVQTSKGHTFGISGGPCVSAFGGSVALSGRYAYSRAKCHQQSEGQGASQSSTVEVTVGKGEAIVIKETVLEVKVQADCVLELVLEVGKTFELQNKHNKTVKVKVKNKDFQDIKWAKIKGNLIFCTFTGKCTFFTTNRKVTCSKHTKSSQSKHE